MQVTIDIPDETAALLQARGLELTTFLEQSVSREALDLYFAHEQQFEASVEAGRLAAKRGEFVSQADVWAGVEAELKA